MTRHSFSLIRGWRRHLNFSLVSNLRPDCDLIRTGFSRFDARRPFATVLEKMNWQIVNRKGLRTFLYPRTSGAKAFVFISHGFYVYKRLWVKRGGRTNRGSNSHLYGNLVTITHQARIFIVSSAAGSDLTAALRSTPSAASSLWRTPTTCLAS